MNELEQPIHLAFKNEIDFIFRYQKKLHYLNTSTKFFKKLNALKFLSLYGFIFCIFPITGLVLISSFFQKNFNPKTTYNDVSLELYVMTNFYSLPFPAMFYTYLFHTITYPLLAL